MLMSDVIGREEFQKRRIPEEKNSRHFLILQEGQFLLDSLVTSQLLVDCFLFWITQLANRFFFLNFSKAVPPGLESP